MNPSLRQIAQFSSEALEEIRAHTIETPLMSVDLSLRVPVYLKLENQQHTGSFKARGSLHKILKIAKSGSNRKIITASTGNHALGVARALKITGMEGTIVLPNNAAQYKLDKLSAFPVTLQSIEGSSLDAELYAKKKASENNLIWISPYNDLDIIYGQGTIGIEMIRQLPHLDIAFITVGGGGLIAGVASVLKHFNPNIKIIGCQPENSPEMKLSVEAGKIVDFPNTKTLSDGSAGGIEPGAITFSICQNLIDSFCLVSEKEIEDAIRLVYKRSGEKIEGAAGVAVASAIKILPESKYMVPVVVICGGNIESTLLESIIAQ